VAELQEENGKLNDALQVGKKPGMYSDRPAYYLLPSYLVFHKTSGS